MRRFFGDAFVDGAVDAGFGGGCIGDRSVKFGRHTESKLAISLVAVFNRTSVPSMS